MKEQLSNREKEILVLILEEHSSQSIAAMLSLSVRTIDTHRKNILRKTNTKTLVGLMKFAIKANLLTGFHYNPAQFKSNNSNT